MKCRYCSNKVKLDSPRFGEKICKDCADLDRIGNLLQVEYAVECLERGREKKCVRGISTNRMEFMIC